MAGQLLLETLPEMWNHKDGSITTEVFLPESFFLYLPVQEESPKEKKKKPELDSDVMCGCAANKTILRCAVFPFQVVLEINYFLSQTTSLQHYLLFLSALAWAVSGSLRVWLWDGDAVLKNKKPAMNSRQECINHHWGPKSWMALMFDTICPSRVTEKAEMCLWLIWDSCAAQHNCFLPDPLGENSVAFSHSC